MVIHGGANYVRHPPAFSNDGKLLLVCTASSVTVLSVATALPVLRLSGHTDTVTSLSVVPAHGTGTPSVNLVWTSSLDGSIRLWDFGDGNVIRTVTVGKPIESMVLPSLLKPPTKPGEEIAFLSVQWGEETEKRRKELWTGRVILFNLKTGKRFPGILAKTLIPRRLVVSPHGNLVGMVDTKKVWIWSVPGDTIEHVSMVRSTLLHHTKFFSVMTFDPTETRVAGGDETGRILLWYKVGEHAFGANPLKDGPSGRNHQFFNAGVRGEDDATACTTYHWHSHEVKSLIFSVDGTYLFSGGSESTLVIWQPEISKQQFLPRLGGTILFMVPSSDPSVFAISCQDNTIRFVNIGSMTVQKCCSGIKPAVLLPKVFTPVNSTRVAFDPHGGKFLLPTDAASVQFYDAVRDHELLEVQIVPRTNISGCNNKIKNWTGAMTFVTHVALSGDGSVMVTVDVRLPEDDVGGGACLKFWDCESRRVGYVLNTLVDEPHGAEITALGYHPFEHMVVTCSLDASFKVWVPETSNGAGYSRRKAPSWSCRSVGSYRHKETLAAAFSPDGSLLAVGTDDLVTLWNPYSNGFVSSLTCVPSVQRIRILAFVHTSKYLVGASSGGRPRLMVWHLPTLSVCWSCYVRVEALAVDPKSSHFGIIVLPSAKNTKLQEDGTPSRNAAVVVLNPENPTPTAAWSIDEGVGGTLFFGSSNLLSSPQSQVNNSKVENYASQSCMTVLTGSHEYVVLNPYEQEDDAEAILPVTETGLEEAPSAYLAMYGNSRTPRSNGKKDVIGIKSPKPWGDLFNAPSHVLPSLTKLSLTFMGSLLQKQSVVENQSL